MSIKRPQALVFSAFLASLAALAVGQGGSPALERPSLVVVLSIDQFRGDYISRFESLWGPVGFRRILEGGAVYENCAYLSANTETGPGHATMLSGTYANHNGITGNGWFDSNTGRSVYCVADEAASTVTSEGIPNKGRGNSPVNMLAETVGDVLEATTNGRAKTLSISMKDRSAILMGGHAVDLAMWWDGNRGELVSSDYYVKALPEWAIAFDKAKHCDQWFKKPWDLMLPKDKYELFCTVDDHPAESTGGYASRTFPHVLNGAGGTEPDSDFFSQFYVSPFSNEFLVDAAMEGVRAEGLGKDEIPDLLTVSFSCNDAIGHSFGPDSWEVMDAAVRTDAAVARFMEQLDREVGAGKWTLFITADHGVAPFPEVRAEKRIDAKRVSDDEFRTRLETHLRKTFGDPKSGKGYLIAMNDPWIHLNEEAAATLPAGVSIEEAVVDFLDAQPDVGFARTTESILASPNPTDPIEQALLYAYYPGKCGQVAFLLKPGYLFSRGNTGTGHGTAYRYDQHVPMLAYGNGIKQQRNSSPVSPPQIAPTVSLLMGVLPPSLCQVPPLPDFRK